MIVLAVLMLLATYVGVRFGLKKFVSTYTSPSPVSLASAQLSPTQSSNVVDRIRNFERVLSDPSGLQPLHLTGQELTWWLGQQQDFALHKGTFVIKPLSNQVTVTTSLPLDFIRTPLLKGRFFNGEAKFSLLVTNSHLYLQMKSLEANGRQLPQWVTGRLEVQNLSDSAESNEVWRAFIKHIDRIELQTDEIILHPKRPSD